jgi:hypothetical protein
MHHSISRPYEDHYIRWLGTKPAEPVEDLDARLAEQAREDKVCQWLIEDIMPDQPMLCVLSRQSLRLLSPWPRAIWFHDPGHRP